jgi:hypothetical protein
MAFLGRSSRPPIALSLTTTNAGVSSILKRDDERLVVPTSLEYLS